MDTKTIIEIFGYIGSALVVVSMLMSSIVKLRIINTVGSVISGAYAVICHALPLGIMNACLIIINVYNLVKLLKTKQAYDLVVSKSEDGMVKYFLDRYAEDIKQYFPDFSADKAEGMTAYVTCCEGNPAGVTIGTESEGVMDVLLDYTTPVYRDCSVAAYLYDSLKKQGTKVMRYGEKLTEAHRAFLEKMGYVKDNEAYVVKL